MYFVLTTAGQQYIADHQGVLPVLSSFKLGSSANYLPSESQTALVGAQVYTGVPSAPSSINQNVIRYTVFIDYNAPTFSFGEIILYLPGEVPFAIGTSSTLILKSQLDGVSQGSSISIDCYIPSSIATGYYPYASLANSSNELMVQSVGSLDQLPPANEAVPNIYSVVSAASDRQSTLAVSDNALWSISEYTMYTESALISAFGTFSIDLPFNPQQPLAIPDPGLEYGEVLIQLIDGRGVGTVRVVRNYEEILNIRRYIFDTPLQILPVVGDSVRIYVKTLQGNKYWNLLSGISPAITSSHINGLVTDPVTSMVRADGTRPLEGTWSLGNNRLVNLANPITAQDAVNLQSLQSELTSAIGSYSHNSGQGLQGGAAAEYYHFNSANYAKLSSWANSGVTADSLPSASTAAAGIVSLSTTAQVSDLSTGLVAVTPSALNSALSSSTLNNLQTAITNKVKELNPLVQTGSGVPGAATPVNPSLYIDLSTPATPVSYAYNVPNATWYKIASTSGSDQGLSGSSLNVTGPSTILGLDASGVINFSNTLTASGVTNLTGNVIVGTNGNNTISVRSTPSFNTDLSINATNTYPVKLGSRSTTNNIGLGQNGANGDLAPLTSITTGGRNTCIGKAAGGRITTGVDNTLLGGDAGKELIGASGNVLLGTQSGLFVTTANDNTAVGFSALTTTGSSGNTAIGFEALYSTTSGSNVGVGYRAGKSFNIGTGNTAVGRNALTASTTGNYNTAIGHSSLTLLNNSNSNGPCTAIGYGSLSSLTTGGSNTAVGYNALASAVNTTKTIAIGNEVLSTYTGTGSLVCIGSTYSGSSVPNSTTTSVIIGNDINASSNLTSANVVIGHAAGASGNNNVTIGMYARGESSALLTGNVTIGYYASIAHMQDFYSSIAIGTSCNAYANRVVVIGTSSKVGNTNLIANSDRSVSIGYLSAVYGEDNVAVGPNSGVNYTGSSVPADASLGCVAIGSLARATGVGSISIGKSAVVTATNAILIGPNTTNSTANSVVIGSSSHTAYNIYTAEWTNISDVRDKKEIQSLDLGLSLINKLNPVKFKWHLRDGGRVDDAASGFIAQEVLDAVGEQDNAYLRVVNTSDPEQLRLSSTCLIPVLVNAVNELTAELEMLKREIRKV